MSLARHITSVATVLAVTLLLSSTVQATDISMANGSVNFTTPDSWLGIMETQGDPEVRVFQVPDSSPTGKTILARVTVTVADAADVNSFHQYISEATAKAMALPGYKASALPPGPNSSVYTARENGETANYVEHYWLKSGHVIQLRCIRPTQSQAGAAWTAAFDKGCQTIATRLK
ncbi:MAG: hypothetical protein ABI114_17620 [Rhodanobacter sp.]